MKTLLTFFIIINSVLTERYAVLSIPLIKPYDENGCCISCGYTYCDTLLECIRPWETDCPGLSPVRTKFINPFLPQEK